MGVGTVDQGWGHTIWRGMMGLWVWFVWGSSLCVCVVCVGVDCVGVDCVGGVKKGVEPIF